MKVKIRKYERLLISLLALTAIINYILQRLNLTPVYIAGFRQYISTHPNTHLNYAANLLLPRIGVVLLLMFVYFWINLLPSRKYGEQATGRSLFILGFCFNYFC